jgi:hypothetical protein
MRELFTHLDLHEKFEDASVGVRSGKIARGSDAKTERWSKCSYERLLS